MKDCHGGAVKPRLRSNEPVDPARGYALLPPPEGLAGLAVGVPRRPPETKNKIENAFSDRAAISHSCDWIKAAECTIHVDPPSGKDDN
jgi:hypothetical protein